MELSFFKQIVLASIFLVASPIFFHQLTFQWLTDYWLSDISSLTTEQYYQYDFKINALSTVAAVAGVQLVITVIAIIKHTDDFKAVFFNDTGDIPFDPKQKVTDERTKFKERQ